MVVFYIDVLFDSRAHTIAKYKEALQNTVTVSETATRWIHLEMRASDKPTIIERYLLTIKAS